MSVSYPKEMRSYAKAHKLGLVTIAVPGMTFQGPEDRPFQVKLLRMLTAHLKKIDSKECDTLSDIVRVRGRNIKRSVHH